MRFGFISPGTMARAVAGHLPTLQRFAGEAVTALRETAAEKQGRSGTGERP